MKLYTIVPTFPHLSVRHYPYQLELELSRSYRAIKNVFVTKISQNTLPHP